MYRTDGNPGALETLCRLDRLAHCGRRVGLDVGRPGDLLGRDGAAGDRPAARQPVADADRPAGGLDGQVHWAVCPPVYVSESIVADSKTSGNDGASAPSTTPSNRSADSPRTSSFELRSVGSCRT